MPVMPNFIPYDYAQDTIVVINFADQILPGTFEHALHYLIEHKLDLSQFHAAYKNEHEGRPAFDPAILLKIVLFAYSKGITSSRRIQWCCHTNIIFKALSCDTNPDFTTIAGFIVGHSEAIASVFEQVVLICQEQGLIGHDLIAIDGCKLPSDAAKEWSGTLEELERKRVKLSEQIKHKIKEHQAVDKAEAGKGGNLQAQRLEQTIQTLSKAHDKVASFLNTAQPRIGNSEKKTEVKSNITDNESCKMTTSKGTIQGYNAIAAVDAKHQIIIDAQAIGNGQEHSVLQPVLKRIKSRYRALGISDDIYKQGLTITADTGYSNKSNNRYVHENGIDAYIPDNQFRKRDPLFADRTDRKTMSKVKLKSEKSIAQFSAEDFHFDLKSRSCFCPAGESMWLKKAGKDSRGNEKLFFMGRLSKCRSCSLASQCMRRPESAHHRHGSGRQVSFLVERSTKKDISAQWMKDRIDSADGKQIYGQRMKVVEPVFGNLRTNKGLERFSLRGKVKVNAQWLLYCCIQNVEKLYRYAGSTRKVVV